MRDILTVLALLGAGVLAMPAAKTEASAPGHGFADQVLRELQRARGEAIMTRVPQHVFVYSNRVEVRAAKRGPGGAWVAPTLSDPVERAVRARLGVSAVDLTRRTGLPTFHLNETTSKEIVFGATGTGTLGGSSRPSALHLYITNDTVGEDHPERSVRLDIGATSGVVTLARTW